MTMRSANLALSLIQAYVDDGPRAIGLLSGRKRRVGIVWINRPHLPPTLRIDDRRTRPLARPRLSCFAPDTVTARFSR